MLEFKPGDFLGEARCRPRHSVQSLLDPPVIIGHQSRLPALQRAVSQDSLYKDRLTAENPRKEAHHKTVSHGYHYYMVS